MRTRRGGSQYASRKPSRRLTSKHIFDTVNGDWQNITTEVCTNPHSPVAPRGPAYIYIYIYIYIYMCVCVYIYIYIYIYLNALRAYPATVPTAQYPYCSMRPDVFFPLIWCTILYCNVSPGVFNEIVYALQGEAMSFFFLWHVCCQPVSKTFYGVARTRINKIANKLFL